MALRAEEEREHGEGQASQTGGEDDGTFHGWAELI